MPNSEQCSLPILFSLEKVRSEAALLCGIRMDICMTHNYGLYKAYSINIDIGTIQNLGLDFDADLER